MNKGVITRVGKHSFFRGFLGEGKERRENDDSVQQRRKMREGAVIEVCEEPKRRGGGEIQEGGVTPFRGGRHR